MCPGSGLPSWPLATFHHLTIPFSPPAARVLPSGLNWIRENERECPSSAGDTAAAHVPEGDGAVQASGGQHLTIGAESQPADGSGVRLQRGTHPACRKVPEFNDVVLAGRGGCSPVGTNGDDIETGNVPLAWEPLRARGGIDDPDVGGIVLRGSKQNLAVAAEIVKNANRFGSNFHR